MGEEDENIHLQGDSSSENKPKSRNFNFFWVPLNWFRMLCNEMHWSSVFGIFVIYGVSQGTGGALGRVASDYYWKDVQKVQPSESQVYQGITGIPWIVKPLWGLLTDVLPIAGYRRRPYFILAGLLGATSMLVLSLHHNLHVVFALLAMTGGSAGVAISDVTIDACAAEHSINQPTIAADIQTLCGFSSSIGALLGFSISGWLVHLMGSQGVFGLMSVPAGLIFLVGILLNEPHVPNFDYGQVCQKLRDANQTMWTTLKCPDVWRPCFYMYISLALSLNIHEGMFYWYTDPKAGPAFSQEKVGFIFSIGSVGSLLGVVLYQNLLKDYPFRDLLFWTQLLYGVSGMLDLVLVLRLNLKLGMPDYFFVVIDESVSQMISRIKWMPLLVLSAKLCPSGIEGTFFALLMSIDNTGLLTSSWGGGLLLHILNVTRTEFHNLWMAILIRNIIRLLPLALLFLVPKSEPQLPILQMEMLEIREGEEIHEADNIELVALVDHNVDRS
ncbi:probable folate-biopterin transporter 2 [Magnolia sinica]|uniref:probable folate-biopterin transporter 2 n=1 Tax=Magnolia sinica TaxID=86752 RepID=UPI0026595FA1|nr:probable folate-biopterin transporter 2 [Magnolia sinica]